MYDGMINIRKEKGFTSFDVIAKLRGILHQKKIGHTGTLDPDATGVLPVCLGRGTKLCDMITDRDKTYIAVMRLGMVTDTQDTSGNILEEHPVTAESDQVTGAVMSFVGDYDQIPPMYSALKVNGRKLYELAREGKVIERQPRHVVIHGIRILSMSLPEVKMEVHCSKGTYIRTLCHDIGEKLGCGGCMASLVRTKVGQFSLDEAYTLEDVSRAAELGEDAVLKLLVPLEDMLSDYTKAFICTETGEKYLKNGNYIPETDLEYEKGILPEDGEWLRIYNSSREFTAIYQYSAGSHRLKNIKMFV